MTKVTSIMMVAVFASMSVAADAQRPQLDRARKMLDAGNAAAALDILETLPQRIDVLEWRVRAHVMMAAQSQPAERCDHLRRATEYASMASASELVELTRKNALDQGCQPAQPTK